jgi:acetylornithine deacetylase/succinyl-diaminopimelate desuccinylase-like protein
VRRYLISVKGPGGHSYGNFGRPNAIHTIGRIVTKLATLDVPSKPKTTYNVGKITGGTTINAIAEEASMEVDLRSEGPAELDRIELKLLEFMREGVAEENKQREGSNAAVTAEAKIIGSRPSGQTPAESPLTQSAMSAVKLLGLEPTLHYSSTDSNLPISLGIPALTLGGGGRGGNAHSLQEWYEPVEPWLGPQMVMLTVLGFDRL